MRRPRPSRARARLVVTVTDARGRPLAAGGLGRWLTQVAPPDARGQVGVALLSDGEVRRLNRRYRRKDRPTDVLSFPASGAVGPGGRRSGVPRSLGDIAIARGVAARQARQFGHSRAVEWRVLALHGLLHLLGYDHETDRGEMSRIEERLRREAGLTLGLLARVRRPARPG
jgi:probable rRNA maturation factor